jgi:hypothetical protein
MITLQMDFYFILYILVSIMTIMGAFYVNYSAGRTVQAALLGVGFIGISIFFGLRWFKNRTTVQSQTNPYPPSINVCPDYLTLTKVNGTSVCVDPVGVSQHAGTNGMDVWSDPTQTDAKFLFDLQLNLSGQERVTALCNQCQLKGVTWEGVWNGTVCIGNEPPMPKP